MFSAIAMMKTMPMIRRAVGQAIARRGRSISQPGPEHGPARPGDLRSNLVDAALAGVVLGWRPEVQLDEGLAITAEWFAARA